MKSRAAGVAAILLLLTAFTVARLQAQNEEINLETIIAEFKAMTALVGRLSAAVLELDARVTALEETAAADPLAGIAIADENRCIPYDADEYSYPQSVEAEIVAAMGGRIYSPYTGETFASMAEVDIDHIVARSEAHESGLCAADGATRRAFASDMLNLTLADPVLNRDQKIAKDVAEWMPARNRCWYAARVVEVKRKYGLTMDLREATAARLTLASCTSFDIVFHEETTPAPQADDALVLYDDNSNGRITCAEARAHGIAPVRREHPAYQYMRDPDGDGVVCER
jgi:hypothetical protein